MFGLAAIQQADGWAMAGAGACIVLSGLTVLSFLISMIPRLTGSLEKKEPPPEETEVVEEPSKPTVPAHLPDDINAAVSIYASFTEELGEDFTLMDLHRKSKEVGLPHPHLSINRFREAGVLIPISDERFTWQPISE